MSGVRSVRAINFFDYPLNDGVVVNLPGYGTTAQRPDAPAIGDSYLDTTLGYPIWWNGAAWVDATGATV